MARHRATHPAPAPRRRGVATAPFLAYVLASLGAAAYTATVLFRITT